MTDEDFGCRLVVVALYNPFLGMPRSPLCTQPCTGVFSKLYSLELTLGHKVLIPISVNPKTASTECRNAEILMATTRQLRIIQSLHQVIQLNLLLRDLLYDLEKNKKENKTKKPFYSLSFSFLVCTTKIPDQVSHCVIIIDSNYFKKQL